MLRTTLPLLTILGATSFATAQIDFISRYTTLDGGGEISAFETGSNLLFTTIADDDTGTFGVEVISYADPLAPVSAGFVDLASIFGAGTDGISSVAVNGSGLGVASIIPSDNNGTLGQIAFFDTTTLGVVQTVEVGYHPDSVLFSDDGASVFVANEGELAAGLEVPGSVSVVSTLDYSVSTTDLEDFNLAGIRSHNVTLPTLKYLSMEPEFMSQSGSELYVSFQENNAVGVFDLNTNTWDRMLNLGTIAQRVDASDRDGGAMIDDVIKGLPMPDAIATWQSGGTTYFATANEGDFRGLDDADRVRVKDLGEGSQPAIDPTAKAALDLAYGGDITDDELLGRLRVSNIDGDTDGDGDLDELIMPGTRSMSIYDEDGNLVADTGSFFEEFIRDNDLTTFNIDDGDLAEFDSRSDDKGPEPEGLVLGDVFGTPVIFIGMERTGGIFAFDVTDPTNPLFFDYINTLPGGDIAPEGLAFVAAADSPNGQPILIVSYEDSGTISAYSVVPEPSTVALVLLGLGAIGFVAWKRRR